MASKSVNLISPQKVMESLPAITITEILLLQLNTYTYLDRATEKVLWWYTGEAIVFQLIKEILINTVWRNGPKLFLCILQKRCYALILQKYNYTFAIWFPSQVLTKQTG